MPNLELPEEIRQVIQKLQAIKADDEDLEQYNEICLSVVDDLL